MRCKGFPARLNLCLAIIGLITVLASRAGGVPIPTDEQES